MSKNDNKIITEGKIIDSLPGGKFVVELGEDFGGFVIKEAYVKGKMRQNNISVMVGDSVEIQIDTYDTSKGIITHRL